MASLSKRSKWRKQLVSVDEYLCVALDEKKGLDSNPLPLAVEMDRVKIRRWWLHCSRQAKSETENMSLNKQQTNTINDPSSDQASDIFCWRVNSE